MVSVVHIAENQIIEQDLEVIEVESNENEMQQIGNVEESHIEEINLDDIEDTDDATVRVVMTVYFTN